MRRRGQRGDLRSPVRLPQGDVNPPRIEEGRRFSDAVHELPSLGGFCAIIALGVKNVFNPASWECVYQSLAEEKKMAQYLLRIMDSSNFDSKLTLVIEEGRTVIYLSAGERQGLIKCFFLWTCIYDGLLRMKVRIRASLVEFADVLALLVVAEKA